MIDIEAEIRDHLLLEPVLTALTSNRIFAAADVPAVGYKPSDGACICFKMRGGPVITEQRAIADASVQFKCYGATEYAASACYRTLMDVFDQARGAKMRWAYAEGIGQPIRDAEQDKGWFNVLVFFTCRMDIS